MAKKLVIIRITTSNNLAGLMDVARMILENVNQSVKEVMEIVAVDER